MDLGAGVAAGTRAKGRVATAAVPMAEHESHRLSRTPDEIIARRVDFPTARKVA